MGGVVLQKVIADAGICSRRKAETYITEGNVTVNGHTVTTLGTRVDPHKDIVAVHGKILTKQELVYFLLHKPKGVLSTVTDDRGRKTVIDLINTPARIVPVGRLDIDTTGLLLLTNDGDLVHTITHPKYEHEKEYEALITIPKLWTAEQFTRALGKMKKGVRLEKDVVSSPAEVSVVKELGPDKYVLSIIIHEGRKHQVRRMINECGMSIHKLKRVRSGFLTLGDLASGEYRELTKKEISEFKKSQY